MGSEKKLNHGVFHGGDTEGLKKTWWNLLYEELTYKIIVAAKEVLKNWDLVI